MEASIFNRFRGERNRQNYPFFMRAGLPVRAEV